MGRRIVSSQGLDIPVEQYEDYFEEQHVERATALHSVIKGRRAYLVGPMARYSLNFDRLSPLARYAVQEVGLPPVCRNPFQSIVVRSVELVHACDEALRIIEQYRMPMQPAVDVPFDAHRQTIPNVFVHHVSSHGVGVAEAIELARTLDSLPPRLIVYGVEGEVFDTGAPLSPLVEPAMTEAAEQILDELRPYIEDLG